MNSIRLAQRLLAFCLLLVVSTACGPEYSDSTPHYAERGRLDLSHWSFESDGPVALKGEWEFYWQQLFSGDSSEHELTGYIPLPGIWNEVQVNDQSLGGQGFATVRLQIRLENKRPRQPDLSFNRFSAILSEGAGTELGDRGCRSLAFEFRFQQTAYTLYVNGAQITSAGQVGTSPEMSRAAYKPHVAQFITCENELDVVIQVSNYRHQKGGLESAISLGNSSQIFDSWENRRIFDAVVFGAILIMAFYHLSLFALRRKSRSALYFSMLCFTIGLRGIVVGQYLILKIFPEIPWDLLIRLEYLSFILPLPFMMLFLASLFPGNFPSWAIRGVNFITVAFALTVLGPVIFFTSLRLPYQVFIVISSCFLCALMVRTAYENREGSRPLLFGLLILFVAVINDVLYNNRIVPTSILVPFGLVFLIFIQSFVLALRFTKAFNEVEILSDQLEQRNQRLMDIDRLKDEFVTNTSHELKTPLTGIIGIAESLLDGVAGRLSSKAENNLAMIVASGKRLANLVNDILDFSKLKHSDITLSIKTVDLKSLTDMILAFSSILLRDKPIKLKNDISPEIPFVSADEDRIQQILTNLIGNAIKFTEKGEISINARVVAGDVEVSVSDTGIGISKDKQAHIFKPFEQVDGSIAREYGGTGLGLAVTKKLVELHQGMLSVNSSKGQGTTFSFTLPIAKNQDRSAAQFFDRAYNQMPQALSKVNDLREDEIVFRAVDVTPSAAILIVDDEPVNIQVLYNQLSMHNYRVISALDGYQALEEMGKKKPDLVILDLMMPKMSGYELCQKIRETYSAADLPIIMLTAKSQVSDLVKGLNYGANDYVTKPFSREELLSRIENQLKIQKYANDLHKLNLNLEVINRSLENRVAERTSELSVKNDQMKQLLHILCHDLLNPFSSLNSIAELLAHDPDSFRELEHYIQTAIANGIAIIEMVKKMGDLAEDNLVTETKRYPLLELIRESAAILDQRLKDKQITLDINVDESLEVLVERTSFVNSVLSNILTNAIKFSHSGSKIEIRSTHSRKQVLLSIRDYGIGMPKSIKDNLFDLKKSTSRKGTHDESGTGYGMPLVKQFVKAYNGTIAITSHETDSGNERRGTEVCLTLNCG